MIDEYNKLGNHIFFMYQLTNVFIERHWNLKLSLLNIVCVGVTYVGKE